MKKSYKLTLALGVSLMMSASVFSQAINEGFDDVTTLTAAGWAQQNLSTPVGTNPNWVQGGTPFVANSGAATSYVAANYASVAGANTISNWLFAPNRTFNNGDVISFFARAADAGYPDRLQVLFSSNGASVNAGATNTSVGDFTTVLIDINPTLVAGVFTNAWVQYTYTFSGLGAPTSGRVAFRYFVTNGGPSGANSDYIGLDDFVYTPFGSPTAANVTATSPTMAEYPIVPVSQVAPVALSAKITNSGTAATTDATLTVNVFQLPNVVTPVYTETSAATSLAIGANSVINFTSYTPAAVAADYLVEFASACTDNTLAASDTTGFIFQVSDSTYARDYANVDGVAGMLGIGAGGGQNSRLGQTFNLTAQDTLTSIDIFIGNTGGALAGQPLRVHVYATAGGVPTTLLGSTDVMTMDTTSSTLWTLPITGGLILPAGMFAVAVEENDSNITVGNSTNVFKNNTVYVKWDGNASGAWTTVETFGASFSKPFVIRPNFANVPVPTGIKEVANTNFSVYPNPTTENILVKNVVKGSTLEVVNALGQVVYSNVVNNTNANINVANYTNGLYMVRVSNGNDVITNSFVKQ